MGPKRNRRTYDQIIDALKQKISQLEERKRNKAVKLDPALKLASKLTKMLKKAESTFQQHKRADLATAARAAAISLEGMTQKK
ncbi:MAG: hypothetical protein JNJ88_19505 [Planctomycetes bacterium]|nr:hypothetical protein [Planctomycetota bacterium]